MSYETKWSDMIFY